jgi:hypothetical protein
MWGQIGNQIGNLCGTGFSLCGSFLKIQLIHITLINHQRAHSK